jgi:Fe-S cluster assembly ATP-binding protein
MPNSLILNNVTICVDKKVVVHNLNLVLCANEVHALMGPNGSGKSSLAYALMGHPRYTVTAGSIVLHGQDITAWSADKRATAGLFLAFQYPLALPGVRVFTFLREAYAHMTGTQISLEAFEQELNTALMVLKMPYSFVERNLNEGFSGGEKKRMEILQLMLFKPTVAILDEIDSGLDIDALKAVADGIAYARTKNPAMCIILITHYQRILDYIKPDAVHILMQGKISATGAFDLVAQIEHKGYDGLFL